MINKLLKYSFSLQRNSKYKKLDQADINFFKGLLNENQIQQDDLDFYNNDWMHKYQGNSELVLFPKNTQQIQQIVKYCNEQMLPIVPQSGNTGLVGGSIPVFDEIVLNLQKMNKIVNFDKNTNIMNSECGVILEHANQYLKQYNCEIPWDLGAKGSCFLGGNVATAAGGKYFVKYGALRGYIIGMEVVTGKGEVLNLESQVRKDNTGLDLKQFFIGSEGSLGIITKLNILCSPIEQQKSLFYVNCSDFQSILDVYQLAKTKLTKNLAAIEWMDGYAFDMVMKNLGHVQNPFGGKDNSLEEDYYVLIEINANNQIEELENSLFEEVVQLEGFKDCIQAQNEQQFKDIWEIREAVGLASGQNAQYQFKYDISLDIKLMDELTKNIREILKDYQCEVVGYGHIGDSNLHINVKVHDIKEKQEIYDKLEPYIFEYLQKIKGSISAEHGLGLMKAQFLHLQKSQDAIKYMQNIKNIFDPNDILNPYKILPNQ